MHVCVCVYFYRCRLPKWCNNAHTSRHKQEFVQFMYMLYHYEYKLRRTTKKFFYDGRAQFGHFIVSHTYTQLHHAVVLFTYVCWQSENSGTYISQLVAPNTNKKITSVTLIVINGGEKEIRQTSVIVHTVTRIE